MGPKDVTGALAYPSGEKNALITDFSQLCGRLVVFEVNFGLYNLSKQGFEKIIQI